MQPQQPYQVPQSSMQPGPQKTKRSLGDILAWVIIVAVGLSVVCGIAWAVIYFTGKTSSDTGQTQAGVAAVLEPESSAPLPREITSQLGVSIPYDARELEGFGFADEVTYSSADLEEARPYTVMRVRPVSTSEATRSEITLASPELRVTSSTNLGYWDLLGAKKEYKDYSKIDMLVEETVAAYEADRMVEVSDIEAKDIGGVSYRKVTFTTTNELYGVTTKRYEDCYMAVQHDRPYVACINNIRSSNFSVVPQLERVLEDVVYSAPEQDVLVDSGTEKSIVEKGENEDAEVADASSDTVEPAEKQDDAQRSSVPFYLKRTDDFKALAAAAVSTVRVGTIYCADIQLTLPNGNDGPSLTGACVDKAGSGFFISRDGLVATSASAVSVKPQEAISAYITNAPNTEQMSERLARVLDYLVEGRIIMESDAEALTAGVEERNQDSIAKVNELSGRIDPEDIAITKESRSYAVQLADRPIVVNQNGDGSDSFAYTDTVVKAELEASDYSTEVTQAEIYAGDNVTSDAALLKLKQSATYPALVLGLPGEGVSDKSVVSFAGMPMYAFGALGSAQFRATPMYRSAAVTQTFNASEGQQTRTVATSSHAGLAGGPVLDHSRQVVGVATYNNLNCPERKCFGNTVIRDTVGISELVSDRNIELAASSASAGTWNMAIDELVKGNYKTATNLFKEAATLYPHNYLATRYAEYSSAQYGSATDTSAMNATATVLQIVAVMMLCLAVLVAIAKIGVKIFIKPHTETQYGAMAQGNYIDPNQWQQTQPPQTAAPLGPMPQPTVWQPSTPAPSQTPPVQTQGGYVTNQPEQTQPPQYPPQQ